MLDAQLEAIQTAQRLTGPEADGIALRYVLEAREAVDPADLAPQIAAELSAKVTVEALFAPHADASRLDRFALLRIPGLDLQALPGSPYEIAYRLIERLDLVSAEPDIELDVFPVPETTDLLGCWVDTPTPPDHAWALRKLRIPEAWAFSEAQSRPDRGEGVLIGQPDTGVATHDELVDAVRRDLGIDLIDEDTDPTDPLQMVFPWDNPGHGTGTASVVVSRGMVEPAVSGGMTGVSGIVTGTAPKAMLVPIRAVRSVTRLTQSRVAQAIDHARGVGCHIITMSLGGIWSSALEAAVEAAVRDNIIVMAAAGNCVSLVVWPARFDSCLAVAGVNIDDAPWIGSCRGTAVDISAPAELVWRAQRNAQGDPTNVAGGGQGTSFAVALMAGVAACWIAHHRREQLIGSLGPGETLQTRFTRLLKATARRPPGWDGANMGAGIADARALLEIGLGEEQAGPEATGPVCAGAGVAELLQEIEPVVGRPVHFPTATIDRFRAELSFMAFARQLAALRAMRPGAEAVTMTAEPSTVLRAATRGQIDTLDAMPEARISSLESRRMSTIVIDPGHGGTTKIGGSSPNNATGPAGTLEKTLTLKVGLRLRDLLSARGHHVIMTRETDVNLGLADRASVAKTAAADAFVSIHFNGWHVPTVQGTETLLHDSHGAHSRKLAESVQRSILTVTRLRDRGVKAQQLGVLKPTYHHPQTACCLAEVSFLTDPVEEQRLKGDAYLDAIAAGFVDGLDAYLASLPEIAPAFVAAVEARIETEPLELAGGPELEDGYSLPRPREAYPTVASPGFIAPPREVMADRPFAGVEGLNVADPARLVNAFRALRLSKAGAIGAEAIVGTESNLLPFSFLLRGAKLGRAVCKIQASGIDHLGRSGTWSGSGFLVGQGLILTNHHVLNSIEVARTATAIFDYQAGESGELSPTRAFRLAPDRAFVTSPFQLSSGARGLDYTFVAADLDVQAAAELPSIPLRRASFLVNPRDRVNIVHHPQGWPKHVSLQDNVIADVTDVVVHYTTDTLGGSSGSPVMTNDWQIVALHHSAEPNLQRHNPLREDTPPQVINEGIRLAAIAADLERRESGADAASARKALEVFAGVDSRLGYFGTLGRSTAPDAHGVEAVVDTYRGNAHDVDIGFWNIEWLTNRYHEKLDKVAEIIADLNLDIWALSESSPEATRALVAVLNANWGMAYDCAFSEPEAAAGKQTTTLIWNTQTINGTAEAWPEDLDAILRADSRSLPPLGPEAVHGAVFPRYPGLFKFAVVGREVEGATPFDFYLVPLHLKAMGEGQLRRRLASQLLGYAVDKLSERTGEQDWMIGGDVNATLASEDFADLTGRGYTPLGAADEHAGAFTYLKGPKSLIDHVFLSPNLSRTFGGDNFFIVARERSDLSYITQISDHRPVLVRLSLKRTQPIASPYMDQLGAALPPDLVERLASSGLVLAAQRARPRVTAEPPAASQDPGPTSHTRKPRKR
ncbi:MAG: N-acetylmuramoyl-L-alanine amidase [Geminicoccaceae bacterium]